MSHNNDSNIEVFIMKNPYQRKAGRNHKEANSISTQKRLLSIYSKYYYTKAVIALYHDGRALCSTPSGQHALSIGKIKVCKIID